MHHKSQNLDPLTFPTLPHRIHGTGMFTYIYHKNQPFIYGKYAVPPMDPMG